MLSLILVLITTLSSAIHGAEFVKGADISWVPGQESTGIVFKDTSGKQRDIFDILKNDYQINTIRLRVFVNPSNDWGNGLCDLTATVGMAKRAKSAGMQLMLTLHYSDSWADPGKQNPPVAWKIFSAAQLEDAVYKFTKEVMVALSSEEIYPEFVQIGNETNDGMLWPTGQGSKNMGNYARFVNAGHKAVKEISSVTQTVVHLSNGFDNSLFRWNIGGLINNNAKFDVIGMSAYPEYAPNTGVNDWAAFNNKVYTNINDMVSSYAKPVIISETGMDYRAAEQCRNMIADMIVKLRSLKNNMGLGVLYWEPQAGPGYNRGYNLGAWGADGRPTVALKGFIENGITSIAAKRTVQRLQNFAMRYPSENGIRIDFFQANPGAAVTLYKPDGRIVYNGAYSGSRLSKGTYILIVYHNKTHTSDKIVYIK